MPDAETSVRFITPLNESPLCHLVARNDGLFNRFYLKNVLTNPQQNTKLKFQRIEMGNVR